MKEVNCPFCESKLKIKIKKEIYRNDNEIIVLYCICNYYYHITLVNDLFEEEAYTIDHNKCKYKLHITKQGHYYATDLLKDKNLFISSLEQNIYSIFKTNDIKVHNKSKLEIEKIINKQHSVLNIKAFW